jgi:aminoglycoside 6'-N-acetyltransferase I
VIERCRSIQQPGWLTLRQALWPHCTLAEHHAEMMRYCADADRFAQFVCYAPSGDALGFSEAAVRTDHVNGTSAAPVLFLEGIYVVPAARRKGIARSLFEAVEQWGRELGYTEVASDALLDNVVSHAMHRALGFRETQRVVFFAKPLAGRE